MEDSWGNFWLGTAKENLYQFKNKKLIQFGPGKGIPGNGIASIMEDKHGNLWVGTLKDGLFCLTPNRRIITYDEPYLEKGNINPDSIRFHFTAPTFISQEWVFFKVKLEGYDRDLFLVYPHERRTIEYRNLPAGNYKFRVTACNNDGVWNKEGANFLFAVSPGFFKTTTFKIVTTAGIPLLLFLGYFLYVKFKQKEKKKQ